MSSANPAGGWAYYRGKTTRVEPTCWSLLALGSPDRPARELDRHASSLAQQQQASGWLVEGPNLPVNIAFNALAAFTWLSRPGLASDDHAARLLDALVSSKGVKLPRSEIAIQDSSLQGWSWTDGAFSWVEPTAWGVLALKKARALGRAPSGSDARIAEADRLLVDRACRAGGWNYGNSVVLEKDLRPFVPTTALALLALQDRRDHPSVPRGLAYLEADWSSEISATALGLTLLCLDVYGRPLAHVRERLIAYLPQAIEFGNLHAMAVALMAVSSIGQTHAFRI
jgi:hypothetical protein